MIYQNKQPLVRQLCWDYSNLWIKLNYMYHILQQPLLFLSESKDIKGFLLECSGLTMNHHVLSSFGKTWQYILWTEIMLTSSNGNIFRVTGLFCAGNSPVPGEFPAQRPVTRSLDVFFDLRLNKLLNKQSWGWWFETLSRWLWRHCNVAQVIEIFPRGRKAPMNPRWGWGWRFNKKTSYPHWNFYCGDLTTVLSPQWDFLYTVKSLI